MSLFTKLCEAVHSWRRRRGGSKIRKRADLSMEQLDHRQLMAVNFTGVAATDFLGTTSPGVQVIPAPVATPTSPGNQVPLIPATLQGVINVSGKEIDQLRVSYTAADDTLNVGVEGPQNGKTGQQVIAGDTDNNLNSATVDPSVTAIEPGFQDPADMGGSKSYGIFLSLKGQGTPDVVAGFPSADATSTSAKPYEVALALPTSGTQTPLFDSANVLPQYTGNYYLQNDPNHPNLELQITHFSQLYQQVTGQAFNQTSPVDLGAFGRSIQDPGISEEFFPAVPISFPQATVPVPVVTPPPPTVINECSPTIFVNYHENNHINTAHSDAIRVNVLGSSGFDPTTIIPSSVKFGNPATIATTGASPILNFERNVNGDEFPDETFVFNGINVTLPSGVTQAELTGITTSGQNFATTVTVFNRDYTYYTQKEINAQTAAYVKYDAAHGLDTSNGLIPPPPVVPKAALSRAASLANAEAIDHLYAPFAGLKLPKQVNPSPVIPTIGLSPAPVSIKAKHGKAVKAAAAKLMVNTNTQALAGGA